MERRLVISICVLYFFGAKLHQLEVLTVKEKFGRNFNINI